MVESSRSQNRSQMLTNSWRNLKTIRSQFHQRFTYSFCARRSQKSKKIDNLTVIFFEFGICVHKSCSESIDKFSPGVNVINVLQAASMCADPKSVKRHWWLNCIFLRFLDLHVQKLLVKRWWNGPLGSLLITAPKSCTVCQGLWPL